jgi:hypothetical protein
VIEIERLETKSTVPGTTLRLCEGTPANIIKLIIQMGINQNIKNVSHQDV